MTGVSSEVRRAIEVAANAGPVNAVDIGAVSPGRSGISPVHWLARQPLPAAPIAVDVSESRRTPGAAAFGTLLASRRSDLLPGVAAVRPLLEWLHLTGRAHSIAPDDAGRLWQSRANPSAGGTHSIEPVLHANRVSGLGSGWYRQTGAVLGDIAPVEIPRPDLVTQAVKRALRGSLQPAATLYAVCDPHLISDRYPEGSSLLWRDAGAFLMTAHLLMSAHGLTSTIVGVCVELAEPDYAEEVCVVGAVAVGGSATGASDD